MQNFECVFIKQFEFPIGVSDQKLVLVLPVVVDEGH